MSDPQTPTPTPTKETATATAEAPKAPAKRGRKPKTEAQMKAFREKCVPAKQKSRLVMNQRDIVEYEAIRQQQEKELAEFKLWKAMMATKKSAPKVRQRNVEDDHEENAQEDAFGTAGEDKEDEDAFGTAGEDTHEEHEEYEHEEYEHEEPKVAPKKLKALKIQRVGTEKRPDTINSVRELIDEYNQRLIQPRMIELPDYVEQQQAQAERFRQRLMHQPPTAPTGISIFRD